MDAQQLLQRLSGMVRQGGGGGRMSERFAHLAEALNSPDEGSKFAGLTELCDQLNTGTEDVLMALRPDVLMPGILNCLSVEHNPDLMFLAARVLTYFVDCIPPAAQVCAQLNGIPKLCEKLLNIADIELAEQCITCLDKIGQECPLMMLRHDAPEALIGFIDFFSIATQRRALQCIAHISQRCQPSTVSKFQPILPRLRQFLDTDDGKSQEFALQTLSRIVRSCANATESSPSEIDSLIADVLGDVVPSIMEILQKRKMDAQFTAACRLLADAAASAKVCESLLEIAALPSLVALLRVNTDSEDSATPMLDGADASGSGIATPPEGLASHPATPLQQPQDRSPLHQSSPVNQSLSAKATTPQVPAESVADLCKVLKELLPPVQDDFMLYVRGVKLVRRPKSGAGAPLVSTATTAASNDSSDSQNQNEQAAETSNNDTTQGRESTNAEEPEPQAPATSEPAPNPTQTDENENTPARQGPAGMQGLAQMLAAATSAMEGGPQRGPSAGDALRPRAFVDQLLRSCNVTFRNDDSWLGCRVGSHSCNVCGKLHLRPGDWYRSNERDDFDACQRCMVVSVAPSVVPGETWTDMYQLYKRAAEDGQIDEEAAKAAGVAQYCAHNTPPVPLPKKEDPRKAILMNNPHFFQPFTEALPVLLQLACELDHPHGRQNCAEFLSRCIAVLPASVLMEALHDQPFCEYLIGLLGEATNSGAIYTTATGAAPAAGEENQSQGIGQAPRLTKSSIPLVAYFIFCCEKLLQMNSEVHTALFQREGVAGALNRVKKMAIAALTAGDKDGSNKEGTAPTDTGAAESPTALSSSSIFPANNGILDQTPQPLHVAAHTEHGWYQLLGQRADSMMKEFMMGGSSQSVVDSLAAVAEEMLVVARSLAQSQEPEDPRVSPNSATDDIIAAQWQDAVAKLVQLFESEQGVSTFELMSSHVLESVVEALVAASGNVQLGMMAHFVTQFSCRTTNASPTNSSLTYGTGLASAVTKSPPPMIGEKAPEGMIPKESLDCPSETDQSSTIATMMTSANSECLLTKLVRQLQHVVTQMETFSGRNATPQRASPPIRLDLSRDQCDQTVIPGLQSPSSRKSKSKKDPSYRTVSVNIEPLATIGAVADFIYSRLVRHQQIPQGNSNPSESAEEENIEEILSELKTGVSSKRARPSTGSAAEETPAKTPNNDNDSAPAAASEATPPVLPTSAAGLHVRFGDQTLSHSLSMLQVLSLYAPSYERGTREAIPLQYSLVPFPDSVKPLPAPTATAHSYAPKKAPAGIICRAALEVSSALHPSTHRAPTAEPGTEAVSSNPLNIERVVGAAAVGVAPILRLLRAIHAVVTHRQSVSRFLRFQMKDISAAEKFESLTNFSCREFLHSRLNNRVLRFVSSSSVVSIIHDAWPLALALDCPFFFPTGTRRLLFEVGFFGTSRAMLRAVEHAAENLGGPRHSTSHIRVNRQKFRVWREHPLQCAGIVMDKYGTSRSMLDFQYYNEVGSGQGPTHEFFRLVGSELRRADLGLWDNGESGLIERSDSNRHGSMSMSSPSPSTVEDDEGSAVATVTEQPELLVNPTHGVFFTASNQEVTALPALPTSATSEVQTDQSSVAADDADDAVHNSSFTKAPFSSPAFAGRFLARAIIDKHVVGLRPSAPLLRMMQGRSLVMEDLFEVRPDLADTLITLACVDAENDTSRQVKFRGAVCAVEDFDLVWTLPGHDDVELCLGGKDKPVTWENCREYALTVAEALLCDGVRGVAATFMENFNEVLSLRALRLFDVEELMSLFIGHESPVTLAEFRRYTVCDHGYAITSTVVQTLFELLTEITPEQQRKFFVFLTGTQLPIGGLASLKPPFTVVRKAGDKKEAEQELLPSAMTCQNYLKLPQYDTKELLFQKLMQAVNEGTDAFHFT